MNVTEAKRRMLGEARKAARLYANLVGTITRIACDDGMTLDIQWKASNFAHLCGLEYYADDNRTRRLPARRLYTDLLSGHGISVKRVAPTGDARWLARKTDVIASAFALDDASMVVESATAGYASTWETQSGASASEEAERTAPTIRNPYARGTRPRKKCQEPRSTM